MAYELKTNTAYRIPVGPLVDPGDGKTAETSLTVTALLVEIYQMKNDGSAVVRASFNPTTSGGNNDMVHITSDTAGMYDLEITAAQINWYGNGRITLYDIDGFLVHWIDIQVVSANYWNNKYGSTIEDVNVASEDNIDFGATKKSSITAAVPTATNIIDEFETQSNTDPTGFKVNVMEVNGTSQTARDIGANVLLSSGSGAGQLDFTSGVVKSSLAQILGTALTETSGQIAAAFKKLFDVGTPLLVASDVMVGTDSANTTTPPTVGEIQTEMEENGNSVLDAISDLLPGSTIAAATDLEAAVDAAFENAIPATPTADSMNDYIQRLKWTLVNKIEIIEANGNTIVRKDDDTAAAATVAAAFDSDATTTIRKRLE